MPDLTHTETALLIAEARRHDAAMTAARWHADDFGRLVVSARGMRVLSEICIADGGSDQPFIDMEGIAFSRNNLRTFADALEQQAAALTAAAEREQVLTVENERLRRQASRSEWVSNNPLPFNRKN